MSYEEKGTWVFLFIAVAAYLGYLATVLRRAADPVTETAYQTPLLWSIGLAIVAVVIARVLVEIVRPSDDQTIDMRDRAIDHHSIVRSWWFLIGGALAALIMALAEWSHFWIANTLYLGFVLQAAVGSIIRLIAYRRGF